MRRPLYIFTDGSCWPNRKCPEARGGYAAVIDHEGQPMTALYGKLDTTEHFASNIRAEGAAIYRVLKHLVAGLRESTLDPDTPVHIYTDSEFWINMVMRYMPRWKPEQFDAKANPDLTRRIHRYWNALKEQHPQVHLVHVRAHNRGGDRDHADPFRRYCFTQNDLADRLASFARGQDDAYVVRPLEDVQTQL